MEEYTYYDVVDSVTVDLHSRKVTRDNNILLQAAQENPCEIASKDKEQRDRQIEAAIEIIFELKSEKPPQNSENKSVEVVLDPDTVSPGCNFDKLATVLGKGNSSKEIILVRDKVTGKEMAYKTIMLAEFHGDEIRTWVCLGDEKMAPELYCFRLNGNKVEYSMKPLPGQTLQDIIDGGKLFNNSDPKMAEKFAMCVLDDLLEMFQKLIDNKFIHGDMHGGNVMVTSSMQLRLIDFGRARHLLSLNDFDKSSSMVVNDIVGIIRIFCAVYSGVDFNDIFDAKKKLHTKNLTELRDCMSLVAEASRLEVFKIMSMLYNTVRDPSQEGFGDTSQVAKYVKKQLPQDKTEFLKKVAVILNLDKSQQQQQTDSSDSQMDGDSRYHYECDGDGDDEDNRIPIWDDPDMNCLIRNIKIEDIQMLEEAVSFF